jgi:hypothetical protein
MKLVWERTVTLLPKRRVSGSEGMFEGTQAVLSSSFSLRGQCQRKPQPKGLNCWFVIQH